LSPDYAIAKNNLGGAYLVQKDWDAAISVLLDVTDDVLYLTPHFSLTNLGIAYYEKGDYAQAEHYLRKALSLEPDFLVAQYNLGRACMAAGKLDEARMIFEEMTEKDPKNPAFLLEIGRVYRRLGDTQNAVLALRGAIERVRTARHLTPDIATEIADAAVAELDQTYP
ncbi:tetratricopeptide repeat protein, partial [Desulfosarcina sp. OttesenSCG-928-G17]|nr:tetratricopeptide repeat protein [Desulfosarcina sp. OttesenSCG-928-G17]